MNVEETQVFQELSRCVSVDRCLVGTHFPLAKLPFRATRSKGDVPCRVANETR